GPVRAGLPHGGRLLAVAMAMNSPTELRMFSLLLVAKPDSNPDPGIRHILKLALRRYGLRCVEARELPPPQPERTREHGNSNSRHGRENAFHRNSTGNDRVGSQDGRGSGTGGTTSSGSDGA